MTALHGFLGRPEDWDGILGDEWAKPDWLGGRGRPVRSRSADASSALESLAEVLNASSGGDTLLGYSMGGRIALHMVLREPERWSRAIIVSASPGLADDAEREARGQSDEVWARRFLHDDWNAVTRDWNAQGVFSHDPPDRLPRREEQFDRRALAAALARGSVAKQADLREGLRRIGVPILWIAGAKDAKYAALAKECAALNPLFTTEILDAGHRVPWGATAAFQDAVENFTTIRP